MAATLALTEQLIAQPSVTPQDGNCQSVIAQRLAPLGFVCETIESGPDTFRVTNLWAKRTGAPGSKMRAILRRIQRAYFRRNRRAGSRATSVAVRHRRRVLAHMHFSAVFHTKTLPVGRSRV